MDKPEHISKVLHEALDKIRDRTNAYRRENGLPLLPAVEEMENKNES